MLYKFDIFPYLDESLASVAPLLGCKVTDLVFVNNASTGMNAALRSLKAVLKSQGKIRTGHRKWRILHLSTVYPFVGQALRYTSQNDDFEPLQIEVAFPISEDELIRKVEEAIKNHDVAMAIFDSITSAPGIINPWRRLVDLCRSNNVFCAIDGAHAIGQISLNDLSLVDPDIFVTNCHKWMHTSRSCAVLYVSPRFRNVITHPISSTDVYPPLASPTEPSPDAWRTKSFHWVGTSDVSTYLTVPMALKFRNWLGGEQVIQEYCHNLAVQGGWWIAKLWGTEVLSAVGADFAYGCKCPKGARDVMVGSKDKNDDINTCERCGGSLKAGLAGDSLYACMVNVRVPKIGAVEKGGDAFMSTVQERLLKKHNIGAQVIQHAGVWYTRFSAQVYTEMADFQLVGRKMLEIFKEG
ncbi:hypothetical protein HDU76_003717 [Blyttiomyces sp. JEL0837]|nr:hypothetical protein HDU76_003717 [Blyttiomyces sp. JEL0837]